MLNSWLWFILAFLSLPLVWLKPRRSIKKVIIFAQSKIGDFVTQTPLFRELKKGFPRVFITVVLTNYNLKALIKCDPNINEILIWDEKASKFSKIKLLFKLLIRNYDYSINLSFQSWVDFISIFILVPKRIIIQGLNPGPFSRFFHRISGSNIVNYAKGSYSTDVYLAALRFLGVAGFDVKRKLFPCPEDRKFVDMIINRYVPKNKKYFIGINSSCGNKLKEWPEDKFARLADLILDNFNATVIFTAGLNDKLTTESILTLMKKQAVDFSGQLNLGQFLAFCEKLNLFISVDSGPLFIANAIGTPVVDISGPVDPKENLFLSPKAIAVYPQIQCRPCSFVIATARECRLNTRECLMKIAPEQVFEQVRKILNG